MNTTNMTDLKTLKNEIRKIHGDVPGLTWYDDDIKYFVTLDLYLTYFDGNLEVSNSLKDFTKLTTKEIIDHIHECTLGDLEFMRFLCETGQHHNGRDLEWLESEGLTVEYN